MKWDNKLTIKTGAMDTFAEEVYIMNERLREGWSREALSNIITYFSLTEGDIKTYGSYELIQLFYPINKMKSMEKFNNDTDTFVEL